MNHPGFFAIAGPFTLAEIAAATQSEVKGGAEASARTVEGLQPLSEATPRQITFFENRKYLPQLFETKAGACLVSAQFAERVPAGTKLVLTTAWDNSANNPSNPNPNIAVTFGEPTTAEMSFGFMNYIKDVPEEDVRAALTEQGDGFGGRGRGNGGGRRNFDLSNVIAQFDADKDGKVQIMVIGVGGFLGMGQHDVGLAWDQVKFVAEPVKTASSSTTTTRATTTGSGATATTAPAVRDYPDHAMVSMTKDQLKALPAFKYASDAKNR